MPGPSNRSVVIISGLLTLLVLGGATLAVAFRNGWVHVTSAAPGPETVTARAHRPTRTAAERSLRLERPTHRRLRRGARSERGRGLSREARGRVSSTR